MSKVSLLDAAGNLVVEYSYDAWGEPIAVTGGMADTVGKLNPFRYRGYVWDEETGLYYLRSRYYRPEWGRFISSDTNMGSEGGFLIHNLYSYCKNKPTTYSDENGDAAAAIGVPLGALAALYGLIGLGTTWLKNKLDEWTSSNTFSGINAAKSVAIPENAITADTRASTLPRWKDRNERPQYWAVEIDKASGFLIVSDPLTFPEAQVRIASGQNVLAISDGAARTLGRVFKCNEPIKDWAHNVKEGRVALPHYHITRVPEGCSHAYIFYLYPYMNDTGL